MADHGLTIIDDWRVTRTGRPEGIALAERAELAGRPVAVDLDEGSAFLGVSAEDRGKQLASLDAPGFMLPDLAGRSHSLAAQRGKKVFLVGYASW